MTFLRAMLLSMLYYLRMNLRKLMMDIIIIKNDCRLNTVKPLIRTCCKADLDDNIIFIVPILSVANS